MPFYKNLIFFFFDFNFDLKVFNAQVEVWENIIIISFCSKFDDLCKETAVESNELVSLFGPKCEFPGERESSSFLHS